MSGFGDRGPPRYHEPSPEIPAYSPIRSDDGGPSPDRQQPAGIVALPIDDQDSEHLAEAFWLAELIALEPPGVSFYLIVLSRPEPPPGQVDQIQERRQLAFVPIRPDPRTLVPSQFEGRTGDELRLLCRWTIAVPGVELGEPVTDAGGRLFRVPLRLERRSTSESLPYQSFDPTRYYETVPSAGATVPARFVDAPNRPRNGDSFFMATRRFNFDNIATLVYPQDQGAPSPRPPGPDEPRIHFYDDAMALGMTGHPLYYDDVDDILGEYGVSCYVLIEGEPDRPTRDVWIANMHRHLREHNLSLRDLWQRVLRGRAPVVSE